MGLGWSGAGTEPDRWTGPEGGGGTRRPADTGRVWSAGVLAGRAGTVSGVSDGVWGPGRPKEQEASVRSAGLGSASASSLPRAQGSPQPEWL